MLKIREKHWWLTQWGLELAHLVNPRSLIRRHYVYDVHDLVAYNQHNLNVNCSLKHLGVKASSWKMKLCSSAKDSVLELVDFPTDKKKLLNASATVWSSLLYTFGVTDFLGRQRRIAFQIQFVFHGLFWIWSLTNLLSAALLPFLLGA